MLNREECGALAVKRMQQVLIDSGLGDKPASRVTGLSNQTIRNIREGSRTYFNNATLIAFADGMNVSLDYLMGRVSEKDMDKYFSDRKIFLKKVYGEVARIEGVREKAEKGFNSFDEMEMAGRRWDAFADTAPYPYNIIADILDAGNRDDYKTRRNIALLPIDEDVEKGLEEAMKRLTDREREFTLMHYRDGKTLEECGKAYGVTRERARQIISKSIRKLRHPSCRLLIVYGYKGFGARKRRELAERELHEARRLESESRKTAEKKKQADGSSFQNRQLIDLDLSVRTYNCLTRAGFHTESDVVEFYKKHGRAGLMQISGLGHKSFAEAMNCFGLWKYGNA